MEEYDLISDEREWSDERNIMLNDRSALNEGGFEGQTTTLSAHSKRSRQMNYEHLHQWDV